MRVGITGAAGFVGAEVTRQAVAAGHEVVAFSRSVQRVPDHGWKEVRRFTSNPDVEGLDVLVHLAGEPIAGIWTRAKRERIRTSRTEGTGAFASAVAGASRPPVAMVCASATGYYGDRGDEVLDENAASGEGFLASVVRDWEEAAAPASGVSRVSHLRFGMVLGAGGGSLPLLGRVFKSGLGGKMGSGAQWMPWVHVEDVARLVLHAAADTALRGPVNAVAPGAVTNGDFTRELASVLGRPAIVPAPAMAIKFALGRLSELLLFSQRAVPAVATAAGFEFRFEALDRALADVFG